MLGTPHLKCFTTAWTPIFWEKYPIPPPLDFQPRYTYEFTWKSFLPFQTRDSARIRSQVDASVETDTLILDSLNIIDSGCGSSVGSSVESTGDLLELYQDFRVRPFQWLQVVQFWKFISLKIHFLKIHIIENSIFENNNFDVNWFLIYLPHKSINLNPIVLFPHLRSGVIISTCCHETRFIQTVCFLQP